MLSSAVRRLRPARVTAVTAAGVLLAVAGCSSSASSAGASASASASASATAPGAASGAPSAAASGTAAAGALPTAPQTPQPAASGQLTGTQLESVLLPAADFPSGYATPASGAVSSGGSLTAGKANYDLATMSCTDFTQHLGRTGFGETAMVSGSVTASGKAFDELIYQFARPAQASAFVAGIQALAGRCSSFKLTAGGQTTTFTFTASAGPSVGGHPSVVLNEAGKDGNENISLRLLLCADGVDAFGVAAVGAGGPAPTTPATQDILYNLMKRQAAAALLG